MATNIPQDDFQKTALRLPKDLHARLHAAAAEVGRSYNAEIIARLEATFADDMDAKTQAVMLGEIYSLLDAQRKQLLEQQKKTLTEIAGMVQQSSASTKAVTTGADEAPYNVTPTKKKRTPGKPPK